MKRVLLSEEARADVLDAFGFYEKRQPGLGARFRDHLDRAIHKVREAPTRYPAVYRGLRRRLVERFPYAVFCRDYPDFIYVVAVMHGRQSPGRWMRRAPLDDD